MSSGASTVDSPSSKKDKPTQNSDTFQPKSPLTIQEDKSAGKNAALTILAGVADDESVLSKLRGIPHIVKLIFILATNEDR